MGGASLAVATDALVAAATVLLLIVLGTRSLQPRNSSVGFTVVLAIWFWATTVWAEGTTMVARDLGSRSLQPSTTFWLTLVPQLLSSLMMVGVLGLMDRRVFGRLLPAQATVGFSTEAKSIDNHDAWYIGGATYFYGQLFTVMALAFSTPGVVFVVKAIEPLSTALLAIPTLGSSFSVPLFAGIVVACLGVALTALGAHREVTWSSHQSFLVVGVTLLSNLGFSTRACVVKKAFAQQRTQPLETFAKITLTATLAGLVPLLLWMVYEWQAMVASVLAWGTSASAHPGGAGHLPEPSQGQLPPMQWRVWLNLSTCYFLYQCSSTLILECIAVESHALLVASKHVFAAVSTSILLGESVSSTMLAGILVTCLGVYIYQRAPASDSRLPIVAPLEQGRLPRLLYGIGVGLASIGVCAVCIWRL